MTGHLWITLAASLKPCRCIIPSLYIHSSQDSSCLTDAPSGNSTKAWESSMTGHLWITLAASLKPCRCIIPSLYIHSSHDSSCLTDAPSGNSTKAWESSTLPGTIYSADQQCKLMLGNTAELCPGMRGGDKVSVLVRVAWCVCVCTQQYCNTNHAATLLSHLQASQFTCINTAAEWVRQLQNCTYLCTTR